MFHKPQLKQKRIINKLDQRNLVFYFFKNTVTFTVTFTVSLLNPLVRLLVRLLGGLLGRFHVYLGGSRRTSNIIKNDGIHKCTPSSLNYNSSKSQKSLSFNWDVCSNFFNLFYRNFKKVCYLLLCIKFCFEPFVLLVRKCAVFCASVKGCQNYFFYKSNIYIG